MTNHDAMRALAANAAHPDDSHARTTARWPDPLATDFDAVAVGEFDRSWMRQAACAGCDTSLWFPERGESTLDVKAVCRRCPVQVQCLTYAMEANERFGTWGAASENERRRMRARINDGTATLEECVAEFVTDDGIDHGTAAGFRSHQRRGSVPCEPCRVAMQTYKRDIRKEAS